jgi:tetratricopeptide (TPR) repeat protein
LELLKTSGHNFREITKVKKLSLSLAIFFCLLALIPAASPVSAKDKWVSVRTKNFLLVGNAGEKQIKQVGARLEQFRGMFSQLFPGAVMSTPVPTTVVVFKNDGSYGLFKPNSDTAGYFQPGEDVNYITLWTDTRGQQNPFNIIFHEYTHLMVNNTLGNVPTWFNEGLAEYYSTVSINDDQKYVLGTPIASHVYLLREKKMLPLRTLFQVNQKSPYYNERDKLSVFYAESWALMHYLILGKGGERAGQMTRFVEALGRNVPMEEAFKQAFSMTFESMEAELRNYISNDRYPILSGQFKHKLDTDADMQAAPLTEAEAQAYLGDLLLHSNRAEAESYLKKALSLDPDLAMAHASMGMLRVRQGKLHEALQSLERAVAADSQNYLIHYYYAYALSQSGQDSTGTDLGIPREHISRMRTALNKAIGMRPDFVESVSLLAYINLITDSQLDESIEMLKRAQSLAKGKNDLTFMLAQVYLAKRDLKMSRELSQKITSNNSPDELLGKAQSLLNQIAVLEEYEANLRKERERMTDDRPARATNRDEEQAEETPIDPSSHLRKALRQPQPGETQTQGTLVKVDCDEKGMTFVIKLADRQIKLRASSFREVKMISFSDDSGREITCGPRKNENNVVVGYVASTDGRSKVDGVAKSLQFVPAEFKLEP